MDKPEAYPTNSARIHDATSLPRSPVSPVGSALLLAHGCLTVLGARLTGSVSRGANPGTDSEFPANYAGNSCQSRVCGVFRAASPKTVKHPWRTTRWWRRAGESIMTSRKGCARAFLSRGSSDCGDRDRSRLLNPPSAVLVATGGDILRDHREGARER